MRFRLPAAVLVLPLLAALLSAQQSIEKLDYGAIAQIRDEGLARSQVMDHLFWMADRYGPRLTGGPQIKDASDWAMKRFADWGLANVHREEFDFGTGWSLVRFSAHIVEPQVQPIIGFPKAWAVGTDGPVTADVLRVTIESDAHFAKYRGQLKGKILLTQPTRAVRLLEGPVILKMDDAMTREAGTTPIPAERGRGRGRGGVAGEGRGRGDAATEEETLAARSFQQRLQQFLAEEGAVAVFDRGSDNDMSSGGSGLTWQTQRTDGGTVFPGTANRNTAPAGVPQVTLAVEHYNRMVRLIEHNVPVKAELDLRVQFHANVKGFNTIAEIPGSDLADQVVLLGAHFDSTNAATTTRPAVRR